MVNGLLSVQSKQVFSLYGLKTLFKDNYGAKYWNKIPVDIRRSPSVNVFCQNISLFELNY